MRRPDRSLRARLRRHPRLALALGLAVIAVLGASAVVWSLPPAPVATTFTYRSSWSLLELQRHIDSGEVVAVTSAPADAVEPGAPATLVARLTDGQTVPVSLSVEPGEAAAALRTLGYGSVLTAEAAAVASRAASASASEGSLPRTLVSTLLPLLLLGGLLVYLFRSGRFTGGRSSSFTTILPARSAARTRGSRAASSAAAAPSTVVASATPTPAHADPSLPRLADVAGCEEAKLELAETVDFLRDPARFRRLGATIPRGILLYGPPGTGKTMLAKAIAAEAGVPFHYASGSEFVEKFVGVGARRVRDLFAQARKLGAGVIFIDEFDAVGRARGGANAHEEREQTLNQLLVEMDGFDSEEELVVVAATNRMDILDPALLRPGRFNRKVHVGLPDVAGRRSILGVHGRNKPLGPTADLDVLARKTYGFSGAMLADLLNEAAILAARAGSATLDAEHLQGGWLKVAVGTARRRAMDERERSIIAAHEVGHAICGRVHGDRRRVEEISLFAHGEALGVTVSSQEDNDLPSETDLRARLVALMGGRAAEELLFHEVTGGAANDFEKATDIATQMVTRFGMGRDPEAREAGLSGRGALSFFVPTRGASALPSDLQGAATRAIRAILDEAYATACETIVREIETVRGISAYLVEHERLDGETLDALCTGRLPLPSPGTDWRPRSARPRDWSEVQGFAQRRLRPAPASSRSDAPHPVDAPGTSAPAAPVVAPEVARAPRQAVERETSDERRRVRDRHRGGLPAFRRRLRVSMASSMRRAGDALARGAATSD